MTIKNMRTNARMTQKEFAEYFNVPQRTIENWEGGKRTPPEYVVALIKYKIEKERLGMLKLIEKDQGEQKELLKGTLEQVVEYLKENENIMDWVLEEDPEMELPNLENIETLKELECELEKINLDWWMLEIKEI